jgi:serine/threonine protein kinase
MSLNAGDRLGAYEIIGPIGAGGMGEVYRARDTKLGRDVALKILPDVFATDPDRLARFERKRRSLRPSIIRTSRRFTDSTTARWHSSSSTARPSAIA